MQKALIFGITGQDGSYLAEFLLKKGYEVHGTVRRVSTLNRQRLGHLHPDPQAEKGQISLHYGDLGDASSIRSIIQKVAPDELYNLGAQSHVRVSFDIPEYTSDVTGLGTLRILEALKDYESISGQKVRYYQASSSEMFGSAPSPQSETTPFHPRSPYAIAKVFAYWTTINYREAYGMYAVNGILFNHESERRGVNFVTRKISLGVAKIKAGQAEKLHLGNLDAKRDWGYAPEYVEAMWQMLQQSEPEDFVIGTGKHHTVREFLEEAFDRAGLGDWRKYVETDPRYYRPAEVDDLRADISKARQKLNWTPKTSFKDLVHIMVDADIRRLPDHVKELPDSAAYS